MSGRHDACPNGWFRRSCPILSISALLCTLIGPLVDSTEGSTRCQQRLASGCSPWPCPRVRPVAAFLLLLPNVEAETIKAARSLCRGVGSSHQDESPNRSASRRMRPVHHQSAERARICLQTFPTAEHTRFQHSLAVGQLSRDFGKALSQQLRQSVVGDLLVQNCR